MLLLFDKFTLMMCFMVHTYFGGNRDGGEMELEKLKSVMEAWEIKHVPVQFHGEGTGHSPLEAYTWFLLSFAP